MNWSRPERAGHPRPLPTLVLLVVCACGGAADVGRPAMVILGDSAGLLRFDADAIELTVERDGVTLLRFPADAMALGRVDRIDDDLDYDPYWLENPLYRPAGLGWLRPRTASVLEAEAGGASIRLGYDENTAATLRIDARAPGRFEAKLSPDAGGVPIAFLRLHPQVDPSEAFYGLGESYDTVNQRGKARAMQLEASLRFESGYNEAHVPIPFLIGTQGWGLFVESPYPGLFEVATESSDRVRVTFGTGGASVDGLTFHLFSAAHPLDVTKHYYDVTGYPRLPAPWALGPWVWRDENRDQAEVEDDANTIRDLDLATSAIWIDRPYASGVNTFDFDPTRFPDPRAMIDRLHALGFRTALWHTPYLDESDPSTAGLREFATAQGFHPPRSGILFNGWGRPIDLTNPAAYAWWQGLIRRYTSMGEEGFKLDYGEDVVPGVLGLRDKWNFHDGSDERTMHGGFQRFYHRVYAETLPEAGGFLLCRHATYGDQLNVSVIWPGDLDASFAKQGEKVDVEGDSYRAVGGLPASLIAGLSLGPSGFPFYGADTGGYRHSPPDRELFTRWFEQTALSTVMQIGTSTNDVAWQPTPENGFDDEMLVAYRSYTRLHLRLFPYEWSYARRIAVDGRPIQRPLGLAHPELGEHPSDEYLFGDDLLVAPVLARGQRDRELLLPKGDWIDWWSGESHEGQARIRIPAPLATLPLLMRAGGIVPLLRPTIDTLAPTTDPVRVDSYATSPGLLYPRVAPGPASSFALFDGTVLTQEARPTDLALGYQPGSDFHFGAVFEVLGIGERVSEVAEGEIALPRAPDRTVLEATEAGWSVDSGAHGSLWVKVGPGAHHILATLH